MALLTSAPVARVRVRVRVAGAPVARTNLDTKVRCAPAPPTGMRRRTGLRAVARAMRAWEG